MITGFKRRRRKEGKMEGEEMFGKEEERGQERYKDTDFASLDRKGSKEETVREIQSLWC